MSFRGAFLFQPQNVRVLIGIVFSLQVAVRSVDAVMTLRLSIHGHGPSGHLFVFPFLFFTKVSAPLVYKSPLRGWVRPFSFRVVLC